MKKAAGIVKTEYFSRIYHVLDTWHSFFQLCVGWCNHFLAGCGWVWHFLTFILLDVGMCDLFFGWVWVGVGGCDLFLTGCVWVWEGVGKCGWVWVSARFITALSKLTWGIWQIFTRALESLKNMHFNGLHLTKACNVSAKKAQRSYLSCHWRGMQNFDKNWLVVRKMTWRIWQIFTGALEILKVGNLMGSFCPK